MLIIGFLIDIKCNQYKNQQDYYVNLLAIETTQDKTYFAPALYSRISYLNKIDSFLIRPFLWKRNQLYVSKLKNLRIEYIILQLIDLSYMRLRLCCFYVPQVLVVNLYKVSYNLVQKCLPVLSVVLQVHRSCQCTLGRYNSFTHGLQTDIKRNTMFVF